MATTINSETTGVILDHYADVIEGGNAYSGGTSWKGIAGRRSLQELLDQTLTSTTGQAASKTVLTSTTLSDTLAARLVRTEIPPIYLLCASQASGDGNVNAARKITAYNSTTNAYTVQAAFPENIQETDTFALREGFKRGPDNWDINADEEPADHGFDRFFTLRIDNIKAMKWYGNGYEQYEAELTVMLRLLKRSRNRNVRRAVVENLTVLRGVLSKPSYRDDGGYVQLMEHTGSRTRIEKEDSTKIVVGDRYRLVYRSCDLHL